MCVSLTRSCFPPWFLPHMLPSSPPSPDKYRTWWPQSLGSNRHSLFFVLSDASAFSHLFRVVFSWEGEVWALVKCHLWGTGRGNSVACVLLMRRSAWLMHGYSQANNRGWKLAVCEASPPSQIITPLRLNLGTYSSPPGIQSWETSVA